MILPRVWVERCLAEKCKSQARMMLYGALGSFMQPLLYRKDVVPVLYYENKYRSHHTKTCWFLKRYCVPVNDTNFQNIPWSPKSSSHFKNVWIRGWWHQWMPNSFGTITNQTSRVVQRDLLRYIWTRLVQPWNAGLLSWTHFMLCCLASLLGSAVISSIDVEHCSDLFPSDMKKFWINWKGRLVWKLWHSAHERSIRCDTVEK